MCVRPAPSAYGSVHRPSRAAGTRKRSRRRSPTRGSRRLSEAIPDQVNHETTRTRNQLREMGWRPPEADEGFAAGQPRFVFQLPIAGRTPDQLLAGMNQLWRRNIKKAAKAGVVVRRGTVDQLPEFHRSVRRDSRARSFQATTAVVLPDHVRCSAGRGS